MLILGKADQTSWVQNLLFITQHREHLQLGYISMCFVYKIYSDFLELTIYNVEFGSINSSLSN